MWSVIFDMDGVIFDTERLCLRTWKHYENELQISRIEDVFPLCIGCTVEKTEEILKNAYGAEFDFQTFRAKTSDLFHKIAIEEGIPLKDGARELLQYLKERGIAVGLASSTRTEVVREELGNAEILDFFQVIIGGDQVKKSKPEPDIYLEACRQLGVLPESTYAIEDSFNGIRSACAAGMHPLMVPDMLEPDGEMNEKAEQIFQNLMEVQRYLMNKKQRLDAQELQVEKQVQRELFAMQDPAYRDFHSHLIPNVEKEQVIGIRVPMLRSYAKTFARTSQAAEFLRILPHTYYEENNLHGFLIEQMKDYEQVICELNRFLPWVDNWATCDLIAPKLFKKHLPEVLEQAKKWMQSGHSYTIRFGIEILMRFFLDEAFAPEIPELVAQIRSEEYYVNMMTAWYFATALAKQYDAVLPFLEQRRLDVWTHNKAIQKAVESRRIPKERKEYLKSLKQSAKERKRGNGNK